MKIKQFQIILARNEKKLKYLLELQYFVTLLQRVFIKIFPCHDQLNLKIIDRAQNKIKLN
jgi:hypothetical protein